MPLSNLTCVGKSRFIGPACLIILNYFPIDSNGENHFSCKQARPQFVQLHVSLQGGLATKDEMCVSFIYYYPAHDISACVTVPPLYQSIEAVDGIETE